MRYYTEDFVRTDDGVELWYSLAGEGELTLATCCGLGCDGFEWKYLARELGAQHRILRWHYRGHGRSGVSADPARISIESFADDLETVLKAAGAGPVVAAGYSMGVQVALEFAHRHPERVQALLAICGAYGHLMDTVHDDNKLKALVPYVRKLAERFPALAQGFSRAVLPSELAMQYALFAEVNRQLVRREDFEPYLTHLSRMDPTVFLRTLEAAARHTAWDYLGQVDVPALVVAADHDRFTPMWLSQRMHRTLPRAELLVVPSGTHTAVIEMPELISLRIDRFLKERVIPTLRARSA